jgi:hypothetical protein
MRNAGPFICPVKQLIHPALPTTIKILNDHIITSNHLHTIYQQELMPTNPFPAYHFPMMKLLKHVVISVSPPRFLIADVLHGVIAAI